MKDSAFADLIKRRMLNGKSFSYGSLTAELSPGDPGRLVDTAMQRARKAGWVEFRRIPKAGVMWMMTDAGREEAKRCGIS